MAPVSSQHLERGPGDERGQPAATAESAPAERPRTRRRALAAGAAALGGALAAVSLSAAAEAATGDPLVLGQANSADATTSLQGTFRAGNGGGPTTDAPLQGYGYSRGVFGYATSGGTSGSPMSVGVEGSARNVGLLGTGSVGTGVIGTGGSTGVQGSGQAYGVRGESPGSGAGAGVEGVCTGTEGVGLRGRGPVGLEVVGRARFSGVGGGTIADRADSARVDDPAITAASHVTVALNADPGGQVQVAWVALRPGRGFTLHLTDRARSATPFTYMVVEPVG